MSERDQFDRASDQVAPLHDLARRLRTGEPIRTAFMAQVLDETAVMLLELCKHGQYVEDSLTAATTGELPDKFDLNQMLLAKRAKAYMDWLYAQKDPRDKLVDKNEGTK